MDHKPFPNLLENYLITVPHLLRKEQNTKIFSATKYQLTKILCQPSHRTDISSTHSELRVSNPELSHLVLVHN